MVFTARFLGSVFFCFLIIYQAYGQSISASPSDPCAGANTTFSILGQPANTSVEWDFCTGDLLKTPTANLVIPIIADSQTGVRIWRPESLELVFDGTNWFGFALGYNDGSLTRFNFGNSLNNFPSVTRLNPPGGSSIYDQASKIKIVRNSDGNWFGFVANNGASNFPATVVGSIVRLNFGNSLTNTPTATDLKSFLPNFQQNIAVTVVYTGTEYLVIGLGFQRDASITTINSLCLNILGFGNDLGGTPTLDITTFPSPPQIIWRDIEFVRIGSNWHAFFCADGATNALYRLDFGADLRNPNPTRTNISSGFPTMANALRELSLHQDGNNYVLFLLGLNGRFFRANLGANITASSATITNFGNFGLLGQEQLANRPSTTFGLVQVGSEYIGYALNVHPNADNNPPNNQNQLVRIRFPNECNSSVASTVANNATVRFLSSGTRAINARILDSQGRLVQTLAQNFTPQPATVANFTFSNQCLGETTQFNNISANAEGITASWLWDFGDGTSSTAFSPSKTYTSTGIYTVRLTATDPSPSTCQTIQERTVMIETPSLVNFDVQGIRCVGNTLVFQNQTTLGSGSVYTYFWDFGDGIGATTSSPANRTHTYTQPGTYQVRLTVSSINGCTATQVQELVITNAATVSIHPTSPCRLGSTTFSYTDDSPPNNPAVAWQWEFDNVGTSTQRQPSFVFAQAGNYDIRLRVSYQNGCVATAPVRSIQVGTALTADFEVASSQGTTLQFRYTGATANSFAWDFGDGNSSTAASPSHTYAQQGRYDVRLVASIGNGCNSAPVVREVLVGNLITSLEPEAPTGLQLYPNPAHTLLNIRTPAANQPAYIRVYTTQGALYYEGLLAEGQTQTQINVAPWPAGTYQVLWQGSGQVLRQGLIISR